MKISRLFKAAGLATTMVLGLGTVAASPAPATDLAEASPYYHLKDCQTSTSATADGLLFQNNETRNSNLDGKSNGLGIDTPVPQQTVATTPRSNFTYTPIIVVHGWRSARGELSGSANLFASEDDATSVSGLTASMIGTLKSIKGAAVYTFDYHDYHDRWVTNDHIGKELRTAINCLYQKTGQKVIAVAHSMGGLALREAMSDPSTARHVSNVYTFDTPNLGARFVYSGISAVANTAADFTSEMSSYFAAMFLASGCPSSSSNTDPNYARNVQRCYEAIGAARAPAANTVNEEATKNLLAGSPGLARLKDWQDIVKFNPELKVQPYTGVMIQVDPGTNPNGAGGSYSAYSWQPTGPSEYDIGDGVVNADSAAEGATEGLDSITCKQQLVVKDSNTYKYVEPRTGKVLKTDLVNSLAPRFGTLGGNVACFHSNTYKSAKLVNDLHDSVKDIVDPFAADYSFDRWIIKPGELGPLKLGLTPEQITQFTGDTYDSTKIGSDITDQNSYELSTNQYAFDPIGLSVQVQGSDNAAKTYQVFPELGAERQDIAKWQYLMPKTDKGIRVGDPQAKVVAAYGLSPKKDKNDPDRAEAYIGSGSTRLGFGFYKNKLAGIAIGPNRVLIPAGAFLSESGY